MAVNWHQNNKENRSSALIRVFLRHFSSLQEISREIGLQVEQGVVLHLKSTCVALTAIWCQTLTRIWNGTTKWTHFSQCEQKETGQDGGILSSK